MGCFVRSRRALGHDLGTTVRTVVGRGEYVRPCRPARRKPTSPSYHSTGTASEGTRGTPVPIVRCGTSRANSLRRCGARSKPLAVFWTADRSNEPLPVPASVVVREGPYRSRFDPHDVVMLACEDLVVEPLRGSARARERGRAGRRVRWPRRSPPARGSTGPSSSHITPAISPPSAGSTCRRTRAKSSRRCPRLARSRTGSTRNFVINDRSVFFINPAPPPRASSTSGREYLQNAAASDYLLVCRIGQLFHAPVRGDVPRADSCVH